LKWLQKVKKEYGLKISTEVASERHVFECLKHGVDLVWIGARTTVNPFLVQEIADALKDTDIPVLVKNPVNPDIDLWIGALERLNNAGIKKLGVIHRGVSSSEKMKYRNDPQWQMAIELRSHYPELPFFVDPSHMGGHKDYILELSQRSLDLGFEGLMIESHCNPSEALSDAKQQLTPPELCDMLYNQITVREKDSDAKEWKKNIDQLRAKIDILDESILYTLSSRMNISRQIGEYKRNNNIAILQTSRWDSLLAKVVDKAMEYNLPKGFIEDVFKAIHEASVEVQNEIISGKTSEQ
jgi:chorismate mutase